MTEREGYALYDVRTGIRVSNTSYPTAEQAAERIDQLRNQVLRRQLEDPFDMLPHLGFVKLTPETWGSNPGDIIDGRNAT